jgi:hypothetical protein
MATSSIPDPRARSRNPLKRSWYWYFTLQDREGDNAFDIVVWWEIRRVPYNVLVGAAGIASIAAWLSIGSLPLMTDLANSEDAVGAEPLSVLAAPFLFNFCYTAGWICEIGMRQLGVLRVGPPLLKLGTGLSLLMVSAVGVWWIMALLVEVSLVLFRVVR